MAKTALPATFDANHFEKEVGPVLAFMRAIWSLDHAMEVLSKRMSTAYGVTSEQRMVIRLVGKFPGVTPGHLAELLHVHPGTMSSAINRLEAMKLLNRKSDAGDRRRVQLELTEKGKQIEAVKSGTLESTLQSVLNKTQDKDRKAALALFDEVVKAVAKSSDKTSEAEKPAKKAAKAAPKAAKAAPKAAKSAPKKAAKKAAKKK